MAEQNYNPLDYKVQGGKVAKNNPFYTIKTIAIYVAFALLSYLLYNYNERITLIEKTFEKKLEDYKRRLEKIEKEKDRNGN
jgi:hypothetical protein